MNPTEAQMLNYLNSRLQTGALCVPEAEILAAVIPPAHPEHRLRPAYLHGLQRLRRRKLINAILDSGGGMHYFVGDYPSQELRNSIGPRDDSPIA